MSTPKKYFHDRLILLLLSVNAFLALAGSIMILFRIELDPSATYIVQFRENALFQSNRFVYGTSVELLAFVIFALAVFAFHFYISHKTFAIKRHFSIMFLGMGTVLLVLSIVVSNLLIIHS
ncbi:MAG: hypothetical protein U5L95_01420 [Candidatus Saccharibacteria bacterium]|nr:hypothetical protein [Candidatus Saccharibacteria bacterium]